MIKNKMAPKKKSSSKKAPEEVGNTGTSSGAIKKQDTCKKHWMLTMKWEHGTSNHHMSSLKKWIHTNTTRATWQLEKAPTTGYEHMQLSVTLKTKQRLTWLKNHFHPSVHAEETNNIEAGFSYCTKSESRIAGPWHWPEQFGDDKVDDPLDGLDLYPWQEQVLTIIKQKPDKRKIYWFWEPNGAVGKTSLIKHILLNHEAAFFQGKGNDIAHAYTGQRICIFGFSRSQDGRVSYNAIESLKDGLVFSGKYDSGQKLFNVPHVIIFANWPPEEAETSADRWVVTNLSQT